MEIKTLYVLREIKTAEKINGVILAKLAGAAVVKKLIM